MKKILIRFLAITVISAMISLFYPPAPVVNAADLEDMSAVLTRLQKNVVADQTILFTTPTGLTADETIILTYESDFSIAVALDYEDIDLSYQATPDGVCETGDTEMTLAAAPTGTTMGVVKTSDTVITFTNGSQAVAAGSEICIQIGTNAAGPGVEQITNPTTAGEYDLAITGTIGEPDSGTIVIVIVDDDSVAVSATVNPSLTFTIVGDLIIGFGTLVSANARFATDTTGSDTAASAHTMTVATNASSGYTVTYNGVTLTATGGTIDVATITGDEDGAPGTEQFAIGFTTDGDATITTEYAKTSNNYKFVASTTSAIITENSPTATETFSAYYLANISGNTEAGSYTTSITYIATGNF